MKSPIQIPLISTNTGCGCGGHEAAADSTGHSGCGCHSSGDDSTDKPKAAHSCGGGCRGIRTPRRIHAALGALLTVFLLLHLGVASLGWVPARYDAVAARLHYLSDQLPGVEIVLIALILAQSAIGVRLLLRSGLGYRSSRCKDDDQARYFFQRWTAVFLLVFILAHLAMFKIWPAELSFTSVSHRFTLGTNPLVVCFYALTLAGLAFHAGNGIWTGASVWGLRAKAPGFWLGLAAASLLVLAALGFIGLWAFAG